MIRRLHAGGLLALAVGLVLLTTNADRVAADDKADNKALDAAIRKSLFDTINFGAETYNRGDASGCYRIFQSALVTVKPLLAHRKEIQKDIEDGLIAAERLPAVDDRAFKLREVLDKVREDLKGAGGAPVVEKKLWDRLGGEQGVGRIVDDFIVSAAMDPKVNFTRGGTVKPDINKLRTAMVDHISSMTGGPHKYTGDMKAVHKGMQITDAEFDATAAHLKKALEKHKVATDDVKAIMTAIESTRKQIVEGKVEPPKKTVWDRIGGEAGATKIVDDFVATASKDPMVNFDRGGKVKLDAAAVAKAKKAMVAQLSSLTGGPLKYEGDMKAVHKGMQITDEEFDATAGHLKKALEKNGASATDVTAIMAVVGSMREAIVEGKPPEPKDKTVWDRLGGEPGVTKIVDDFVATASKDPKVNIDRGGKLKLDPATVDRIKKSVVAQISSVTGGPLKFGEDMKAVHKGMQITDAEFDAHNKHLKDALEKNKVKPEDAKVVLDAFEKTRKDVVEPKKPDDTPKGEVVEGKVTFGGKPVEGGKISFVGDDNKPVTGNIKDGAYTVSGLKPGRYKVTIIWDDKLPARFGVPETTPLRTDVKEGKQVADWDLKP